MKREVEQIVADMIRASNTSVVILLLTVNSVSAELKFNGVLLNSGEYGAQMVDFAWQRTGSWSHLSSSGDGVFIDEDGSLWAAGRDGVGQNKRGYIYKYSKDGKVAGKYCIEENRSLLSKIAGGGKRISVRVSS